MKSILVHGGAWATPAAEVEPHREGALWAARAGWEILKQGGSALDAVEAAVRFMESDPTFNAGRGANLNALGDVELDAAIMDGFTLRAGAVGAVSAIEHPVELARRILDRSSHHMLVGPGAAAFAAAQGVAACDPAFLVVPRERERFEKLRAEGGSISAFGPAFGDTVGAVACDGEGHLAAANSTGGSPLKLPGRVGDSPLVGCGLYADDRLGAAACTGWGEGIIRIVMARRALDFLAEGRQPTDAAERAVGVLEARTLGRGGVIIVAPDGTLGSAFNTPHMAHAYMTEQLTDPVALI